MITSLRCRPPPSIESSPGCPRLRRRAAHRRCTFVVARSPRTGRVPSPPSIWSEPRGHPITFVVAGPRPILFGAGRFAFEISVVRRLRRSVFRPTTAFAFVVSSAFSAAKISRCRLPPRDRVWVRRGAGDDQFGGLGAGESLPPVRFDRSPGLPWQLAGAGVARGGPEGRRTPPRGQAARQRANLQEPCRDFLVGEEGIFLHFSVSVTPVYLNETS